MQTVPGCGPKNCKGQTMIGVRIEVLAHAFADIEREAG